MLVIGIGGPGANLRGIAIPAKSQWLLITSSGISRQRRSPILQMDMKLRCLAQISSRQAYLQRAQQERAKAVSYRSKIHEFPERLIIYHAGTGKITFLAMLKLTSLLLGAFFALLVVPSYVAAEKPRAQTAAVAMASIVPILLISYTTAPFVTHIHIHLPPAARISRPVLERFIGAMPASTRLTFTTMSIIAKPRYSSMTVGDLRLAKGRFGLVNYMRDTRIENLTRKWYMYKAVGSFYVQGGVNKGKRYERKDKVDRWIWDAVGEKVQNTRT